MTPLLVTSLILLIAGIGLSFNFISGRPESEGRNTFGQFIILIGVGLSVGTLVMFITEEAAPGGFAAGFSIIVGLIVILALDEHTVEASEKDSIFRAQRPHGPLAGMGGHYNPSENLGHELVPHQGKCEIAPWAKKNYIVLRNTSGAASQRARLSIVSVLIVTVKYDWSAETLRRLLADRPPAEIDLQEAVQDALFVSLSGLSDPESAQNPTTIGHLIQDNIEELLGYSPTLSISIEARQS